MLVIAGCVALVALGIALVVQRGGGAREDEPHMEWPRYVAVSLGAGLAAGVLAAGAGGRLMMRLLGATSPDVHGLTTEAGEIIGEITLGGTLAFLVFVGLPAGFLSGGLYALVAPLLPSGRARGVALGVLLLVLFATRIDPLRADSIDFLLLEPAWLAVLGFSALALLQGMLVAALAPPPKPVARSRVLIAGRIALAVVVLAALPGFIGATADILSGV
ncbi:MAG TPA: hypothetical protein VM824_02985 [Thermoleophilaceae bacterium]|nr:hypothetical protein [Thermoleophilaceae bacterium]